MIVEGERAEPRLMGRALELYGISDVRAIYSYQANVYDLYRTMFEGAEDVDDLYLPLVLRERERDPDKRELLNRDYTDIILIFDFDPQDHLFSQRKLEEMVSYFDESTENGKLYVNYPMVEAYRDLASLSYDDTYLERVVSLDALARKSYKEDVGLRSHVPQLEECNVIVLNQILIQNLEKAGALVGCGYIDTDPMRFYDALTQAAILAEEGKRLRTDAIVSVLCTCLWFVIDYRPEAMARYLRSFSA